MLKRQKTVLALLSRLSASKASGSAKLVKLMFLLRHETELQNDNTFYDFVPYRFGPFSFALYRELSNLRRDGYVALDENSVMLNECNAGLVAEKIDELPPSFKRAVDTVVGRYGTMSSSALVKSVYSRFPWYATRSELTNQQRTFSHVPGAGVEVKPTVYTAGYQGASVDLFFNRLLKCGIELIIDVRANPISRRYGFSKRQLSGIAEKLELEYCHLPSFGIPSRYRANLKNFDSYQRLLSRYEQEILPGLTNEIEEVAGLVQKKPAVLVCMEKDVRCCHRSRVAEAISRSTGLAVTHL